MVSHGPSTPAAFVARRTWQGPGPWLVSSGTLYRRDGQWYTGAANETTGSEVFRIHTRRANYRNVTLSFVLRNLRLSSTPRTPPRRYDGVHVGVRWRSPYETYYVSVNRRDQTCLIKKKVPGGPSNGGTYLGLSPRVRHRFRFGAPQHVRVRVTNAPDGSVSIALFIDGRLIVVATDRGAGGPPLSGPGRIAIRGDNDEFTFGNVTVTPV